MPVETYHSLKYGLVMFDTATRLPINCDPYIIIEPTPVHFPTIDRSPVLNKSLSLQTAATFRSRVKEILGGVFPRVSESFARRQSEVGVSK